jgi:rare lipoprotein A
MIAGSAGFARVTIGEIAQFFHGQCRKIRILMRSPHPAPLHRCLRNLAIGLALSLPGVTAHAQEAAAKGNSIGEVVLISDKNAGRETASGQAYDPAERTAAHRTLPLGSLAWVTNLANGRSVLVRVNDRGPTNKKQEMALSRNAAEAIGLQITGTARAQIAPLDVAVQARPAAVAAGAPEEFAIAIATYPDLLRAIYRQMGLERNGVSGVKLQKLNRQGSTYYRVILGGFASPEAASAAANDLETRKMIEPR